MKFYNTLTRNKEKFVPIDSKNVRMYVCGPTVYDDAHIGNARAIVVFDMMYRLLRHVYGTENVCYVRNITDVDDKINSKAKNEFPNIPINEGIQKITEKTIKQFNQDMKNLNCLIPNHQPKATEYISEMIKMINILITKGHAYLASWGNEASGKKEVLFRTESMKNYGMLSMRYGENEKAGARIKPEKHKENPRDFVLWKESEENEPAWEASFNGTQINGRPGWHIECSTMSAELLGEVFDIHGGGNDLIFPHHENEIAQSCCVNGTDKMANLWMHNGMLKIEGKKMSKSLNNFLTVQNIIRDKKMGGENWSGEVVRLCLIMTAYREPLDFTLKKLEQCKNMIGKWKRQTQEVIEDSQVPEAVVEALGDDLNVAKALSVINKLEPKEMKESLKLLGFELNETKQIEFDPTNDIKRREKLIKEKKWEEADKIRDQLLQKGIKLNDQKDEKGNRITKWEVI